MSVETLERPLVTPNQEEIDNAKQILHEFISIEGIEDDNIPEASDLDVGKDLNRFGDSVAETFSHVKARENYDIIVKTAKLNRANGLEDLDPLIKAYKPITDERIGSALLRLSDGFRSANTKGYFTAYETKQPADSHYVNYDQTKQESVYEYEAPWDARRRPIQLEAADVEALSASTEDDKIAFLSEILNPYRYRKDTDAPSSDIDAQAREVAITADLLNTLPDSWRRDLMATEAVKFYLNKHVNKPELAQNALQLISTPELRDSILASIQFASESSPQKILSDVESTSPKALERLLEYTSEDQKNAIKQEAIEKANQFAVTINMPLINLEKVLFDTFHILSFDRTKKSSATGWEGAGGQRRRQEDRRGFHPQYESILDRPIYAALVVSDKEKINGAAPRYGGCVITLKDEVALNRTIYTYGDSSHTADTHKDSQDDDRLAMPEATVAKILYDKETSRIGGDYIEAQILGGVDVNDIESITIPWRGVLMHFGILKTIQEEYPSLNLSVSVDSSEKDPSNILSEEDTKKLTDRGIKVLVA